MWSQEVGSILRVVQWGCKSIQILPVLVPSGALLEASPVGSADDPDLRLEELDLPGAAGQLVEFDPHVEPHIE